MAARRNTGKNIAEQPLEDEPSQWLVDFNDPKFIELIQGYDRALEAMRNSAIHFAELVASHERGYRGKMVSSLSETCQSLENVDAPVLEKVGFSMNRLKVLELHRRPAHWVPDNLPDQGKTGEYHASHVEEEFYDLSSNLLDAHTTHCDLAQDFKEAEDELHKYIKSSISEVAMNELKKSELARSKGVNRSAAMRSYLTELRKDREAKRARYTRE